MTSLQDAPATPKGDIAATVDRLRATFRSGRTRPVAWREEQLDRLRLGIESNADRILEALAADLGKPAVEGWLTDIGFVTTEIAYLRRHLAKWARPTRVRTPATSRPGRSELRPEPLGVVSVIAPWNYPVQLAVVPLAAALAAGNAVVVKPSEVAPATSDLLARLLPACLDADAVAVVEGGVPETTELLAQRVDHVFYTGNGRVGRLVMKAAAEHLTPVTLELGGKSPCIVDRSADLTVAARRIVWGKFLNAGQTCVAPDYVLVHRDVAGSLVDELVAAVRRFHGDDARQSADYGRIVSGRHLDRLMGLLPSGRAVIGGDADAAARYLAPTILVDVAPDSPVMEEEIFGPILPVLEVASADEAIEFVADRPHPLALYVFAADDAVVEDVLERTTAGGVTVNGTLLHLTSPLLPFGGVGESGMGAYHGKAGFDTFTHHKPVLRRSTRVDPSLVYPPYGRAKAAVLKRVI